MGAMRRFQPFDGPPWNHRVQPQADLKAALPLYNISISLTVSFISLRGNSRSSFE
jgi:hypothetical protein